MPVVLFFTASVNRTANVGEKKKLEREEDAQGWKKLWQGDRKKSGLC